MNSTEKQQNIQTYCRVRKGTFTSDYTKTAPSFWLKCKNVLYKFDSINWMIASQIQGITMLATQTLFEIQGCHHSEDVTVLLGCDANV